MIAIITAMQSEAEHIITEYSLLPVADNIYANDRMILGISGIGKIYATMQLTRMLEQYPDIRKVINIGVVGALDPTLSRSQIVTVSQAHEHDGYIPDSIRESDTYLPIDIDPAPIDGIEICTIMTGDQFIETEEKKDELFQKGGHICDMECYAYAQVCRTYDITFHAVKMVIDERSDTSQEYKKHLDSVVTNLPQALKQLIS